MYSFHVCEATVNDSLDLVFDCVMRFTLNMTVAESK